MKSLLLQAADEKVITKEHCRHVRRPGTPCPGKNASSGDESTDADCSSGGYISGAKNSDDDPGSLDLHIEHDNLPQTANVHAKSRSGGIETRMMPSSPVSGYSAEDYYQHYSPKQQAPTDQLSNPESDNVYPGKVMKEAYSKKVKWTKIL